MAEQLRIELRRRDLDWDKLRAASEDIRFAGPTYTGPMPPGGNTFIGIWGIKVVDVSYGNGNYQEFTDFPLAPFDRPEQLQDYPWPSADHYDYASLRQQLIEADPDRRQAVKFAAANPFEIFSWMYGLEQALVSSITDPDFVHAAMRHITSFFDERLRRVLEAAGNQIDLVFLADDVGSQNGPLMSRDMYRQMLQPYHRRLIETARRHAPHIKVMYHSDGSVFDLLPDLLDSGIDMLEAVQVETAGMEPQRLKQHFGDRLCFQGAISVQQVLPRMTPTQVRQVCRDLVQVLGDQGGYIAAPSHAIQVGTPVQNVVAMLEQVLGPDDYKAAVDAAVLSNPSEAKYAN
jgi:uroporphyrinogen decarboxylase